VDLRGKVVPTIDPAVKPEQVDMTIELTDGRVLRKHIEHAIGSLERPMSDDDLERKFTGLADSILSPERTAKLIELCWSVENLGSADEIAEAGAKPAA
jgi:2-methylcitrate dehydratase PrpD